MECSRQKRVCSYQIVIKYAIKSFISDGVNRMANHEFGIMETVPKESQRFDKYEPQKYEHIKINDGFIEPLLPEFQSIPCFWHTLKRPEMNLAYSGITLIPPESIDAFISVFNRHCEEQYKEIIALFEQAKRKNKYIIHFGI